MYSWTDLSSCSEGLRQGEVTSPLLLSLLINKDATDIMANDQYVVQLFPD